jgi:outer membrane protein TolC
MRHEARVARLRRRLGFGAGLALTVLSLEVPATADEPRRVTMEEALVMAETAPVAQASAFEVQRVRAEGRGSGLWPNPEAQFDRAAAGEEVERIATLSVALPLNGRLGLERSAARSALMAAERRARQERIERRARVRELFVELVAAQERDRVVEAGRGRLDGLVRVLRAREAEGESSGYDRMRAEQEYAELTAQRLEARAAVARARAGLASLLGLTSEPLVADGTLEAAAVYLPSAEDARAQALARGDVEAFSAEADQRDLLGRAAGRRVLPEPALVVGRKTLCAAAICDSGAILGFALSLPVFDRGQGSRAALRAEADLARTRRHILALDAQAEADAAMAEVRAGREAEAALAQAPPPEKLLAIAQASYEAGEVRIFELLDAYRSALSVALRVINLRLAVRKAEVVLDRATGVERIP